MKFLLALLFCGIIASALSALAPLSDFLDPENPDKCLYEGHSLDVGVHDNIDPNSCYRVECLKKGKGLLATCGIQVAPPNCKFNDNVDLSKPYPACCDQKVECLSLK